MDNAKVLVCETQSSVEVPITGRQHPTISPTVVNKWQRLIDLVAKVYQVPAGLIMQITEEEMQVFLRSRNPQNPYSDDGADRLGQGLYCETVIGENRPLAIKDALSDPHWRDNPDVKRNMISYCGLPVRWPDGSFFGTICILDSQARTYQALYQEVLASFRESMEDDLRMLEKEQALELIARTDYLTGLYNRRELMRLLEEERYRVRRTNTSACVILLDLNDFKAINDTFGHDAGDELLQRFASALLDFARITDHCGRWGGDEFLMLCPETDYPGAATLAERFRAHIAQGPQLKNYPFGMATGIAELIEGETASQWVMRADQAMYRDKHLQKRGKTPKRLQKRRQAPKQ
ncbi:sensor domain-containing diguanylate cyclase [Halochromatium sp.]